MNTTENQTVKFAAKVAFSLKNGKRGRPVKGNAGDILTGLYRADTNDYVLGRPERSGKSWIFTQAQVDEWFDKVN